MSREGGTMMSFGPELVYSVFLRTVADTVQGIETPSFPPT